MNELKMSLEVSIDVAVESGKVKGEITTPKSGSGQYVWMAPQLAELLVDVLAERRRECLRRGLARDTGVGVHEQSGRLIDQDNFERPGRRARRSAQTVGVRPMRLLLHQTCLGEPRLGVWKFSPLGARAASSRRSGNDAAGRRARDLRR